MVGLHSKQRRLNLIWFLLCLILCCLTRMISDSDNKILSSCRIEPAMNKITGSLLEWTIEVFISYYFNLLAVLAISTCWLSIYIPIYHYHKNWTTVRWNKKGRNNRKIKMELCHIHQSFQYFLFSLICPEDWSSDTHTITVFIVLKYQILKFFYWMMILPNFRR